MISGFEVYKLFTALKLHFTTDQYDFFAERGGVRNITEATYLSCTARFTFERLGKKFGNKIGEFFVSNFIEDSSFYIQRSVDDYYYDVYLEWLSRKESLSYIFENEIKSLCCEYDNLDCILISDGEFPILLKKTFRKEICLESLIIMDNIMNFMKTWDKNIEDDLIWNDFYFKCKKYRPFMKFEKDKYKKILIKILKNGE